MLPRLLFESMQEFVNYFLSSNVPVFLLRKFHVADQAGHILAAPGQNVY
jgi:hypothetical protein